MAKISKYLKTRKRNRAMIEKKNIKKCVKEKYGKIKNKVEKKKVRKVKEKER